MIRSWKLWNRAWLIGMNHGRVNEKYGCADKCQGLLSLSMEIGEPSKMSSSMAFNLFLTTFQTTLLTLPNTFYHRDFITDETLSARWIEFQTLFKRISFLEKVQVFRFSSLILLIDEMRAKEILQKFLRIICFTFDIFQRWTAK